MYCDVPLRLTGTISAPGQITGTLQSTGSLSGALSFGEAYTPEYEGAYIVTPLPFAETVLPTTGKRMADDVTVLEIPYYETSNPYGGYTVNIGG